MSTDQRAETDAGRLAVRATADSNFAWLRTRLALENTLMAWVRTAIALIGFGFSIVEIFNRLGAMPGIAPALRPEMPRYVGLFLIAAGVLGLLISCAQYPWISNYLWSPSFAQSPGCVKADADTRPGDRDCAYHPRAFRFRGRAPARAVEDGGGHERTPMSGTGREVPASPPNLHRVPELRHASLPIWQRHMLPDAGCV